jgi:signal transduction histidine kinase
MAASSSRPARIVIEDDARIEGRGYVASMVSPRLERVDQAVGALLFACLELVAWFAPGVQGRWVASLVFALMAGAVAVRRRWPLGATAVAGIAVQFQPVIPSDPQAPATLLVFGLCAYGVGAFLPRERSWPGLLGLFAIATLIALRSPAVVANLFFLNILPAFLPWAAGRVVRARAAQERASRERAEALDAASERAAAAAAETERTRIAREIHDVVAHGVSVMVIQAAGARTVMDRDPTRAEASLRAVERAGREALAEMRRLVGLLGDDGIALAPQPGLADLAGLVSRSAAAGMETTLSVEGEPRAVAPGLGLCAYRIVQEALTNAIKHARAGHAEVRVRWCPQVLELEVLDDGPGGAVGGDGHGIPGMRERAALQGGTLEAGSRPGGGFAVLARIPLGP